MCDEYRPVIVSLAGETSREKPVPKKIPMIPRGDEPDRDEVGQHAHRRLRGVVASARGRYLSRLERLLTLGCRSRRASPTEIGLNTFGLKTVRHLIG
jgi:hypothetical protein